MPFGTLISIMPLLPTLKTRHLIDRPVPSLQTVLDLNSHQLLLSVSCGNPSALILSEFRGEVWAGDGLVARLGTVVAGDRVLLGLLAGVLDGQVEFGVHELAGRPVHAQPADVVGAYHPPGVPVPAVGPVPAEPAVVPRAVFDLRLRVDVQEGALFVAARVEPGIEVALRHLAHVVLMQELALVALFAQAPQPVLADDSPVPLHVSEGTVRPFAAEAPQVEVADRGAGLVHTGERQGKSAELLLQSELDVEPQVSRERYYILHCCRILWNKQMYYLIKLIQSSLRIRSKMLIFRFNNKSKVLPNSKVGTRQKLFSIKNVLIF